MANTRRNQRRRGRPIGSRNTRVNQYIRIRSVIWANRKDQYDSYFDPKLLTLARRVNDQCKTAGTECDDELILTFHDEWSEGGDRYPLPLIDPTLFSPTPYWEIKNVSDFAIENANIFFYSPMLIPPPSGFRSIDYASYITADGRQRLSLDRGYRRYFKQWVDWVNSVYRSRDINDSEFIDVYFKLLEPEWNEDRKLWVVQIVSCTSDGRVYDFGFDPNDPDQSESDFISPEDAAEPPIATDVPLQLPPESVPTTSPTVPSREQIEAEALKKEKERELEKKKKDDQLELLQKLKDDAKSDYKFWKEMDDQEEMDAAKARIKDITKQIDSLRNGN